MPVIDPPANQITMEDNKASAYRVFEGANDYITIDTVNAAEIINFHKNLQMDTNRIKFINGSETADLYVPTVNGDSGFTIFSNNNINLITGTNFNVNISDDLAVNDTVFFVDASTGYVGIGDNTPSAPLDIRTIGDDGIRVGDGTDYASLTYDDTNNRVVLDKTNPNSNQTWIRTSDVGNGALIVSDVDTDNTEKHFRVSNFAYVTSQNPVSLLSGMNESASNEIIIGGKSNTHQAATVIHFYTTPVVNTMLGFSRMTIFGNGDVGINEVDPEEKLHVVGNILTTGSYLILVTANIAMIVGDVVKPSTSTAGRFIKTTTTSDAVTVGIAVTAASGSGQTFHMAIAGIVDVLVDNTVSQGDYLRPAAVNGRAESVGTSAQKAVFGQALEDATSGNLCSMIFNKAEIF